MKKFLLLSLLFILSPFSGHAATCDAGQYLNNNRCTDCPRGYYCNSDDIYKCPDVDMSTIPNGWIVNDEISVSSWRTSSALPAAHATDCKAVSNDIHIDNGTCYYMYSWNGANYWNNCETWRHADIGYYLSGFIRNISNEYAIYTYVKQCENTPPANAHFTENTPADNPQCQWVCDDGYYDDNGTCTLCPAGTYWNDGVCDACGSGYFCTGGTHRQSCESTVNLGGTTPYYVLVRSITPSSVDWSEHDNAESRNDCICNFYYHDDTAESFMYQAPCHMGPVQGPYLHYYNCRTGYYASNPLSSGEWYQSCTPCNNGPTNSHYTLYSIPSEMYAVESNCPWECDAGYGRTVWNTCEPLCAAGITQLHTSTGLAFNLYANKLTSPAVHIKTDTGAVCYVNLATGTTTGAVHFRVGDTVYHTTN